MGEAAPVETNPEPNFAAFREVLGQHLGHAEREIIELGRKPVGARDVRELFRVVNRVRMDAVLRRVGPVVRIARAIEDVVRAMVSGAYAFEPAVGEVILLGLDRMKVAIRRFESGRPLEEAQLERGAEALFAVAASSGGQLEECLRSAVEALVGREEWSQVDESGLLPADILDMVGGIPQQEDLRFFRQLALGLEARMPYWHGRIIRQLQLAFETNAEAGSPIDPTQLEAAVYMHDVGMAFISESIWQSQGPLDAHQWEELKSHPTLGAGLLGRMADWVPAAEIVAQHHERPNGRGYPRGLRSADIVPGAKLLAILDAFEAMTQSRVHRQNRKSVVRAIAEVNACDDQFAREWVDPFNRVVRRLIKAS